MITSNIGGDCIAPIFLRCASIKKFFWSSDNSLSLQTLTYINLTAGDYALIWGSVDPQQLATQNVIISCDTSNGDVNITLPQSGSSQSNNTIIHISKVTGDGNVANVSPADGDLLSGDTSSFQLNRKYMTITLVNFFVNNWSENVGF